MAIALTLTAVLFSIFIADLKWRRIYLLQLITLNLLCFVWFFNDTPMVMALIFKAGWITVQLLLLFLYVRLARGRNFFSGFGLGDLLFLVAIIPVLDFSTFIVYYISGLLFSLLGSFFFSNSAQGEPIRIPLAGLLSLWMVPFLLWETEIETLCHRFLAFTI